LNAIRTDAEQIAEAARNVALEKNPKSAKNKTCTNKSFAVSVSAIIVIRLFLHCDWQWLTNVISENMSAKHRPPKKVLQQ
jgi:hypothetical protein